MLSQPKVIERLNRDFIPLEINLTDQGWPKEIPALWGWKLVFGTWDHFKKGYTGMMITTPDGKTELGSAGDPSISAWKTSAHYHEDKFHQVLDKSLAAFKARKK